MCLWLDFLCSYQGFLGELDYSKWVTGAYFHICNGGIEMSYDEAKHMVSLGLSCEYGQTTLMCSKSRDEVEAFIREFRQAYQKFYECNNRVHNKVFDSPLAPDPS